MEWEPNDMTEAVEVKTQKPESKNRTEPTARDLEPSTAAAGRTDRLRAGARGAGAEGGV